MAEDVVEIKILSGESQTWGDLSQLSPEDRKNAERAWRSAGYLATLKSEEATGERVGRIFGSFSSTVRENTQAGMPYRLSLEPSFLGNAEGGAPRPFEVALRIEPSEPQMTLSQLKDITSKVSERIR